MEIGFYIFFAFIAGILAKMTTESKERQPNIEIYYEDELVVTLNIDWIGFYCEYNYNNLKEPPNAYFLKEPSISCNVVNKKIHNTILYEQYCKNILNNEPIIPLVLLPYQSINSKWKYKINI